MELEILERAVKEGKKRKVALIFITEVKGSAPRGEGTMMLVTEDSVYGSIGGGKFEYMVIEEGREAIKLGKGRKFNYNLSMNKELEMVCGGDISGYIKIIKPKARVIILGAGHIGKMVYKLFENLDFDRILIDDRDEIGKECEDVSIGNFREMVKNLEDFEESFYVIASNEHKKDLEILIEVINKKSRYIGILGGSKKKKYLEKELKERGIEIPKDKIFIPIGLKIDNGTIEEIAVGIVAEIIKIKNIQI